MYTMTFLNARVEFFEDYNDKKFKKIVPGRHFFLAENNFKPKKKELIHAVSYNEQSEEKETTHIELYIDQICIAASHNFPSTFFEVIISMISEELIGQFCMNELKMTSKYSTRWVGDLLAASVIDEIVDEITDTGSYSKKIRERSAHRLMQHFVRR